MGLVGTFHPNESPTMYVMGSRDGVGDGTGDDDGVELGDGEGDRAEGEGEGTGTGTGEGDGRELGCGAGEDDVGVTVMDNVWPLLQWPGKEQMKWRSPAEVSVILAGLLFATEMGLVLLQESEAVFVTSVTSCRPLAKLKTRMSPTTKVLVEAQSE